VRVATTNVRVQRDSWLALQGMVKLLGRMALWQRIGPPRGRIHIGKIARFKTPAHEKALPFFVGHIYQTQSDRRGTDLPAGVVQTN